MRKLLHYNGDVPLLLNLTSGGLLTNSSKTWFQSFSEATRWDLHGLKFLHRGLTQNTRLRKRRTVLEMTIPQSMFAWRSWGRTEETLWSTLYQAQRRSAARSWRPITSSPDQTAPTVITRSHAAGEGGGSRPSPPTHTRAHPHRGVGRRIL